MEEKGVVRVSDVGKVATPAPTARLGDNAPVEIPQHRAAKLAASKLPWSAAHALPSPARTMGRAASAAAMISVRSVGIATATPSMEDRIRFTSRSMNWRMQTSSSSQVAAAISRCLTPMTLTSLAAVLMLMVPHQNLSRSPRSTATNLMVA